MADMSIHCDKAFESREFADLADAPVDALAAVGSK